MLLVYNETSTPITDVPADVYNVDTPQYADVVVYTGLSGQAFIYDYNYQTLYQVGNLLGVPRFLEALEYQVHPQNQAKVVTLKDYPHES